VSDAKTAALKALHDAEAALLAAEAEVSTPADEPVVAPVAVAVATVAPAAEAKRGPAIKNGKLYPSVR
jgi:hypothetical protein